jgi:hypothetical protein
MTLLEILVSCFGFAVLVFGWVVIDYLRQMLDALHTLVLRESERRQWMRRDH